MSVKKRIAVHYLRGLQIPRVFNAVLTLMYYKRCTNDSMNATLVLVSSHVFFTQESHRVRMIVQWCLQCEGGGRVSFGKSKLSCSVLVWRIKAMWICYTSHDCVWYVFCLCMFVIHWNVLYVYCTLHVCVCTGLVIFVYCENVHADLWRTCFNVSVVENISSMI